MDARRVDDDDDADETPFTDDVVDETPLAETTPPLTIRPWTAEVRKHHEIKKF